MEEKETNEILSKRKKMINIHIIIILTSIPQIIIGFLYFKIFSYNSYINYTFLQLFIFLLLSLIIFLKANKSEKNHYLIGLSLSIIFSFSISMTFFTYTIYYPLYLYFITLCIYHYSEYLSVLIYHFNIISCEYFLIDHSKSWVISTLASFAEMIIETYFFDQYKKIKILFIIGLLMTIIGQYFRIAALFTGKKNFTHKIRYNKVDEHELVTHGIYSLSRHPSYFGFFIWSVGIEVMCCNPICTIAFTIILFNFFKNRIISEESFLIQFFGEKYLEYKKHVGILIPFIHMDKAREERNLKIYLNKKNMGNKKENE
jgi:protein-S-isoprenylcysteine O-methyltransferase